MGGWAGQRAMLGKKTGWKVELERRLTEQKPAYSVIVGMNDSSVISKPRFPGRDSHFDPNDHKRSLRLAKSLYS